MASSEISLSSDDTHQEQVTEKSTDTRSTSVQKTSSKLEWPLFPTPSISLLQVIGYETYNATPYYIIVVGMAGGFRWSVLKNYDEIAFLHKQLVDDFGIDKSLFPQRRMFGSHKKEYLKEMQGRLGIYLTSLLQLFSLSPPILLRFLEYKFSDILSITETLSNLFYERGDEFLETNCMIAFSPLQLHCVCRRMVLPIISERCDMRHDFGHLLDFLQHLRKVKVCPPCRELFPLSSSVELTFDLSIMKSLDTLVLNSIDLSLIQSLGGIPQHLETLGIHKALSSVRDILKHTCLGVDSGMKGGYQQWTYLRVMDLSYNDLTSIDSSLTLAPNLEVLNLSHNRIKDIDNLLELPHLRVLDLSHNELIHFSELHCRLGNITTLYVANNALNKLTGLEKCYSIVCLDIQNNSISMVGEISNLASLPLLEQLMVKGNAFTASPSYRQHVFSLLPKIARQLSLDGKPPSKDELEVSASLSTAEKQSHKKSATRQVDIRVEDEEDSVVEQKPVPPIHAGTRRHMEQMRKEGGENWLSMLNQQSNSQDGSPGKPKKKHKNRKTDRSEGGNTIHSVIAEQYHPGMHHTPSSGLPSSHLQLLLKSRECNSPWSCSAAVLEYTGMFRQLSHKDIDHLLANSSLEACLLMVDTKLGRIIEDFAVAGGGGRNRSTRDLTFLQDVRVHEGDSLAIAIELTTFMSHSTWIIYCLRDYPSLADFYLLLSQKLQSTNDAAPPSPQLLSKQLSLSSSDDNEKVDKTGPDDMLGVDDQEDWQVNTVQDTEYVSDDVQHEEVTEHIPSPLSNNKLPKSKEPSIVEKTTIGQSPPIPVTLDTFIVESSAPTVSSIKEEKPGLGDENLCSFFTDKVAKDDNEVLMYVLWCGLCLPSTFPYKIDGVVFISSCGFYVLEIKHQSRSDSRCGLWNSENLPLLLLISARLDHLSRIMLTGILHQNVLVELHDKSPIGSVIFFPPTSELTCQLIEQFKAAMDSASLHYTEMESLEAKKTSGLSGVILIKPDAFSADRFKQWLSQPKTRVRLANFIATNMNKKVLGLYEVELKQGMRELAESFEIVQELVAYHFSIDIFPSNNGGSSLIPQTLILTNSRIFLCQEAFISGPALRVSPAKHTFSPLDIVRSIPVKDIKEVTVCERLYNICSSNDPIFEFSIATSIANLCLCVHDQQYLAHFVNALKIQFKNISSQELTVVHTSNKIPFFPKPHLSMAIPHDQSPGKSISRVKPHPPLLVKSEPLLQFASLPHWARIQVFKEHIAQADFMKSDETLLNVFLGHCQLPLEKKVEIEACIIVSNYANYFLSDMDGIRTWLDAGGSSSFARMSLLNPENDGQLQCFYRLWHVDLTKVHLDPLLLSVRLCDKKPNNNCIDILTGTVQCTAAMLSALASTVGFKDPPREKDVSNILEDFVDVTDDPFGENTPCEETPPSIHFAKRSYIELSLPDEAQLTELKLHLVESHPDVARGSSVTKCSENVQILVAEVALLAEQLRVRDSLLVHYRPHLVLLTNFGLFFCSNPFNGEVTPSLLALTPSQLVVKKWVRVDDIQRLQLAEDAQYHVPQLLIYTRPPDGKDTVNHICLVSVSNIIADIFVTYLSLVWEERIGQSLPIEYLD